jgi:hypothetical protein
MGRKLAHTHTRNINPFGAFIEMPTVKLTTNDFVEIHFVDRENNKEHLLQKGLVMHRNDDGVGVLFAYDSAEFRKMLRHKIAGKSPPEDYQDGGADSSEAYQNQAVSK